MPKLPVYLYNNKIEVIIDLEPTGRTFNIMYQRDLVLQKGVRNTIQFEFKNSDQKILDVSTQTFVLSMFDATDNRLLIEKPLEILDDGSTYSLRGLTRAVFNESDLEPLDTLYYNYSIKRQTSDSNFEPAYANTYYGIRGTLKINNDIAPTPKPTTIVTSFQLIYNPDIDKQWYEYYSGNLRADPEFKTGTALHTLAMYLTRYRGKIIVEGTLDNTPGSFDHYATLVEKTYNQYTGIDYVNFNGVFSYVRVRYIPDKNPSSQDNRDTSYAGTVDKIMYRS